MKHWLKLLIFSWSEIWNRFLSQWLIPGYIPIFFIFLPRYSYKVFPYEENCPSIVHFLHTDKHSKYFWDQLCFLNEGMFFILSFNTLAYWSFFPKYPLKQWIKWICCSLVVFDLKCKWRDNLVTIHNICLWFLEFWNFWSSIWLHFSEADVLLMLVLKWNRLMMMVCTWDGHVPVPYSRMGGRRKKYPSFSYQPVLVSVSFRLQNVIYHIFSRNCKNIRIDDLPYIKITKSPIFWWKISIQSEKITIFKKASVSLFRIM